MNKQLVPIIRKSIRPVLYFSLICTVAVGPILTGIQPVKAIEHSVADETALRNTVVVASNGDTIRLTADIQLSSTSLEIPAGKTLTLTSDTGTRQLIGRDGTAISNSQTIDVKGKLIIDGIVVTHNPGRPGTGIMVFAQGELELKSGSISGNTRPNQAGLPSTAGGVFVAGNSRFIMNGGEIASNFASGNGGGVFIAPYGNFVMNGGEIYGNSTAVSANSDFGGGGIYAYGGLTMNDGEIHDNASGHGGGIYVFDATISGGRIYSNTATYGGGLYFNDLNDANVTIANAEIHKNIATNSGGGIYIRSDWDNSSMTLSDVTLNCNSATSGNGGGVYVSDANRLIVAGATSICNNHADAGNGGGIYTTSGTYGNLTIGSGTIFLFNTSSNAYEPPINADTSYLNIRYKYTSITTHPLNNADINYSGAIPAAIGLVYYDANGGIGSYIAPPIKYCAIPHRP